VLEAAVAMMTFEWGLTAYGGRVHGRRPGHSDVEPNYYTRCRDGDVIIAAFTEQHWRAFVDLMGDPAWAREERFADVASRTAHWDELHRRIDEWAMTQSGNEILEEAQQRGLPFCPSLELWETLANEHVQMRNAVEEEGGRIFPADPILVDGVRRSARLERATGTASERNARPNALQEFNSRSSREGDGPAPLADIRVLDLTQYVAGPFAAQTLASLGAEVVLVESGTHLVTRQIPPFAGEPVHNASMNFNYVNRGKKSVLVNLRTDEGRGILDELLATADVVLENFSRRAVERLGLTWAQLSERHPSVVLGSISGFGRSGPWGGYVALHSGVILMSGLASVTRDERARPRLVGSIYPDLLTGAWLAAGVQQALLRRAETGEGAHVEVSMLDVLLNSMGGLVDRAVRREPMEETQAAVFLPTNEPNRFVALAANAALDVEELGREAARRTRREAMDEFQSRGFEAAAVLDIAEVMNDPHLTAQSFVQSEYHPVAGARPAPGVPWLIDGTRTQIAPAPLLGADTEHVLGGLGRDPQEMKRLVDQGVLV
jgi:benzylsuccinate CoA-transferase BbsF subunit